MRKSYMLYYTRQVLLCTWFVFAMLSAAQAQYSNIPPLAKDVELCVVFGNVLDYDLNLAVFDPNDDPVSISILKQPLYGSLTLDKSRFSYKPDTSGVKDIFVYSVCDNKGLCDVGSVTIDLASETASEPTAPEEVLHYKVKIGEKVKINYPNIGYRLQHNGGTEYNTIYTLSHDGELTKLDYVSDSIIAVKPLNTVGTDNIVLEGCSVTRQDVYTCEGARLKYICKSIEFIVEVEDSISIAPPIAKNVSLCLVKGSQAVHTNLKTIVSNVGNTPRIEIIREGRYGVSNLNPDKIFVYSPADMRNIPYGKIDSLLYRVCNKNGVCDTAKIYIRFAEKATNKKEGAAHTYRLSLDENLVLCGNLGKTLKNTKANTIQADTTFGKWTRQTDDCVLFRPNKVGVDTVRFLTCRTTASTPFYSCDGLQDVNDCEVKTYIIHTFMRKMTSQYLVTPIKSNETWSMTFPNKVGDILTAPRNGTLSVKKGKSSDKIVYLPKSNFVGVDSFKLACTGKNYFSCEDKWYKIAIKSPKDEQFTIKSTLPIQYNIDGEAKKIFVRSATKPFTGALKVRIFNTFDEEVFLKTIRRERFEEIIDLKTLPSGVYKVAIQAGNFLTKERMVVQ
jgi:large repetitive protein